MHIDLESIVILAGTCWVLYRAFSSMPAEYDRKNSHRRQ